MFMREPLTAVEFERAPGAFMPDAGTAAGVLFVAHVADESILAGEGAHFTFGGASV